MDKYSKIYVSERGYKQYLEALEQLKEEEKRVLAARGGLDKNSLPGCGQGGDYPMYHNDLEYQKISTAIANINQEIMRLEIVSNENASETEICIGDIVTIQQMGKDEIGQYKLTGAMMPDLNAKIQEITIRSPLGKAILGRNVGDNVTYTVTDRSGSKKDFEIQIISKEGELEKQTPQPE